MVFVLWFIVLTKSWAVDEELFSTFTSTNISDLNSAYASVLQYYCFQVTNLLGQLKQCRV